MHGFKDQLEDLAFAELNKDGRDSVLARLDFLRGQGQDLSERIIGGLRQRLAEEGIAAAVSGRMKTPYPEWRKMQRKNVSFEQLSAIMAFCVVVGSLGDCYQALGLLPSRYPVVPGRYKDYISTPRPNGYRSQPTHLLRPERHRHAV